ncbi:MAG: type II toxin-antitoxin system Phd/YefM family antitoxin [Planctomycetota bacterium]|nr:type II toxin-antitoxin system Phd/YefM family antitoxin [Planctomycetota bacterium]
MGKKGFVPTGELKKRADALVHEVSATGEPCYITEAGKAKAVLLDVHRYHAMMDLIEEGESLSPQQMRMHASIRNFMSGGR